MVLADWEMGYNGLVFGGAQVIGVMSVSGLDLPSVKGSITPKTATHGSSVFEQFFDERHIIIEGDIFTTGTVQTQVDTLRTTFVLRTNDIALTWQRPGVNRRRVMCRPMRLSVPEERGYDLGDVRWVVELVASDPSIYDDVTSTKLYDG